MAEIELGGSGGSGANFEIEPKQGPGLVDKLANALFPQQEQELEPGG